MKIRRISVMLLIVCACTLFIGMNVCAASDEDYHVKYSTKAVGGDFLSPSRDGKNSGKAKSGKAIEAFQVWLIKDGKKVDKGISYRAHVQGYGWMRNVYNGKTAGCENESKRVEAIQIRLPKKLSKKYNIFYRVYVQNRGWLGWSSNGQSAGSTGQGLRIESMQVMLVKKGEKAPGDSLNHFISDSCKGRITYQTHMQSYGWIPSVSDGALSGAPGQNLRMEGIRIWMDNPTDAYGNIISGDIEYSVHSQSFGWQTYVNSGEVAGIVGQGKRMEAIKIRLTGNMAKKYDVYYRVRCNEFGTLGWAKNGEIAGTVGCAKNIESIEIKLYKKNSTNAPKSKKPSYIAEELIGKVSAKGFVQEIGWQNAVGNGGYIGTTGQKLRLEAMKLSINTSGKKLDGAFEYSMYVQGEGWQQSVTRGKQAGTTGKNLRAEAVKISLSGDLGKYCDVWYRAQVEGFGWLGWAKNGQEAGSKNAGLRMEALQIYVLPKGANVPGENKDYLKTTRPVTGDKKIYDSIIDMSSKTNYIIAVDTNRCLVGIYQGAAGRWQCVKEFICGPGKPSSPTVKGQFTVTGRGGSFGTSTYTCWYYTQFYGDYLFHSVLYAPGRKDQIVESGLGTQSSHGCVRLSIEDAKWIYDEIPDGTKVYIY